jgi:hypothetical protein
MDPKPRQISVEELANGVRSCYGSDSTRAESLIEKYLETMLEGFPLEEKLAFVEKLRTNLRTSRAGHLGSKGDPETATYTDLFSLILGQRITGTDLGSEALIERLAGSLNSIFDQLNALVGIINATFGEEAATLETIRHIIGSDLVSGKGSGSLAGYIGQIKEAFLVANEASKAAAVNEVSKILAELDPDLLAREAEKGLRFGFMRKGELFETYREKYGQIKKWFEAGHFVEDFSREFEKACQRLHSEKGRTT